MTDPSKQIDVGSTLTTFGARFVFAGILAHDRRSLVFVVHGWQADNSLPWQVFKESLVHSFNIMTGGRLWEVVSRDRYSLIKGRLSRLWRGSLRKGRLSWEVVAYERGSLMNERLFVMRGGRLCQGSLMKGRLLWEVVAYSGDRSWKVVCHERCLLIAGVAHERSFVMRSGRL